MRISDWSSDVCSSDLPGMVTAQTFDAPGQAFSVAVSPYDDSDLNLKLKADFEAALAERWQARMIEEAAAAFLLLFESEVVPADMAPPPPSLGSARLDGGGAAVTVNVWSSSQNRVLAGRQESKAAGTNVFPHNTVLRPPPSGGV